MMITSTLLGLCGLIAGINAQLMDDFEDMNDLEAKQSVFGSYGPPPQSMVNLMRQQPPMSLTSFTAQKQSPARRVAFAPSSIIASSTKSAVAVAIPASTSNAGQSGFLNRHNYYRAMHQAPPLFWDNGLASSADAFSSRCTATHSGTAGVGENIYWNSIVDQADVAALDSWYSEKSKYDFGSPGFSPNAVHFTALVWKETKLIGCGSTKCPNLFGYGKAGILVVCQYSPQGNNAATFGVNVLPKV